MTLTNTDMVPESLTLESGSSSATVDIEKPDGGWSSGENRCESLHGKGSLCNLYMFFSVRKPVCLYLAKMIALGVFSL